MRIFLLRDGPPNDLEVSILQKNLNQRIERWSRKAGIYSRLKSSNTVWPNGCSESESKSGISSYWTVREVVPEALMQIIANETKQRANNNPGHVGRVIPCQGLASLVRGTTVHTTSQRLPY